MSDSNTRPLSPHLSVYKLPLTALLSITHRLTGVVLACGTLLVTVLLLAVMIGGDFYSSVNAFLGHGLVQVILFLWSLAWMYHMLNGIRHLLWDVGYGLSLNAANRSGVLVIVAAIVLTVSIWLMAKL